MTSGSTALHAITPASVLDVENIRADFPILMLQVNFLKVSSVVNSFLNTAFSILLYQETS